MSTAPESPDRETPVDRPPDTDAPTERYVGLATRVIAFVLDAALIDLVAIIVAIGAALILSLLHLPKDLKPALVAIGGAHTFFGRSVTSSRSGRPPDRPQARGSCRSAS